MSRIQIRSFALLSGKHVYSCRRAVAEFSKHSNYRPLHAAPALFLPRRRGFFSSNAVLRQQEVGPGESGVEQRAQTDQTQIAQIQKRKTARTSAAKTSLRRVAVEAQRSKDSSLSKIQSTGEGAQTTKAVTAYAVAEQFNLAKVDEILRAQGYEPDPLSTGLYPQVVHIQVPLSSIHRTARTSAKELPPSEVGDVFIFPSGTLVSWSLPEAFTSYFATRTLLPAAEGPHVNKVEFEDLDYVEDPTREHSSIKGDTIILGTKPDPSSENDSREIDSVLTKIAFSSGFARSTKLAVLETMLLDYFNSTRDIPTLLSRGSRLPYNRSFILRKTGQLLSLRAQLNLYSELTDSLPDLFWDSRHELGLEGYYDQVGRALDVGIRIKVLNEKMDYAQEIASVLRERLSEKHGLVLEWTIITLIAVEVGFEILRLWKEGWLQEKAAENELSTG
jgi:required for meiotic nuclear division protein 1